MGYTNDNGVERRILELREFYKSIDKEFGHKLKELKGDELIGYLQMTCVNAKFEIDRAIFFFKQTEVLFDDQMEDLKDVLRRINSYLLMAKEELYKLGTEPSKELEESFGISAYRNFFHPSKISLLKNHKEIEKEIRDYIKAKIKEEPDFPYYCEVGALFAQGLIRSKKIPEEASYKYYYKNEDPLDFPKFWKYIKEKVIGRGNPRQILQHSFDKQGDKNIYTSKRIQKIYDYCKHYNIEMVDDFIKEYENITKEKQN
ncbi:hypothetical protein [Aquimarina litoralis]|uniref:hypothetical protein n=1 Tax=Aquimarina litoralis TaxID=584605 RepID=UPI001C58E936|nr:hypothetical protein [Aquimarina litoralis]MBW1297777.1 hypothetical protein [Aquimarina litoralis]